MPGCCGGRSAPRPRAKPPRPEAGREVLAVYTGDREGLFSLRGAATGQKYLVSLEDPVLVVWSGDLENGMERVGVVYAGELADAENVHAGDPSPAEELRSHH